MRDVSHAHIDAWQARRAGNGTHRLTNYYSIKREEKKISSSSSSLPMSTSLRGKPRIPRPLDGKKMKRKLKENCVTHQICRRSILAEMRKVQSTMRFNKHCWRSLSIFSISLIASRHHRRVSLACSFVRCATHTAHTTDVRSVYVLTRNHTFTPAKPKMLEKTKCQIMSLNSIKKNILLSWSDDVAAAAAHVTMPSASYRWANFLEVDKIPTTRKQLICNLLPFAVERGNAKMRTNATAAVVAAAMTTELGEEKASKHS